MIYQLDTHFAMMYPPEENIIRFEHNISLVGTIHASFWEAKYESSGNGVNLWQESL